MRNNNPQWNKFEAALLLVALLDVKDGRCTRKEAVATISEMFTNPFLAWGKYRRGLFKTTLPVSFQFHHAQMDGLEAARFLNGLQDAINQLAL